MERSSFSLVDAKILDELGMMDYKESPQVAFDMNYKDPKAALDALTVVSEGRNSSP